MNFLQMVETASRTVGNKKSDQPFVMISLTEEVGELAQELKISHGQRTGPAGKDGVVGEAIDTILCALDIIHSEVGHLDETYLCVMAEPKIRKWLSKVAARKAAERAAMTDNRADFELSPTGDCIPLFKGRTGTGTIQLQHLNNRFTDVQ